MNTVFVSQDALKQAHRDSKPARGWLLALLITMVACLMGLGAMPISAAAPSLEPGVPVTGVLTPDDPTLDDGTHYDTYTFYGHTGEVVRFHLSSSEMDMYLLLVDGKGRTIAEDDDSGGGTDALVEVTIPAKGTYHLLVNTFFPGSAGEYVLVWEDPNAPFLTWGEPVHGELTGEDPTLPDETRYDAYVLVGWEGEIVRLSLASPDVDAYLVLTDAEGNRLANDDDSGGGTDALLEYTLPSSGVYRVLANTVFPEEAGRYTLTWEAGLFDAIQPSALELGPGVSLEGELTDDDLLLDDGTYYDVHFLEGRQGQELRLRLSSPDVDAYLVLMDAEGDRIASDDDSGGGTDALIVMSLPEDGVYMVVANTIFPHETGRYTLTWEEAGL